MNDIMKRFEENHVTLKRTNEDKRKTVEFLLKDEEFGVFCDREIARLAGVSHPFVSKIRKEMMN